MERREKPKAKSDYEEEDLENHKMAFSDSDDEAANEDLTLKIVEKAMARATHAAGDSSDVATTELAALESVSKKKSKKPKKKKKKVVQQAEAEVIQSVSTTKIEELVDTVEDAEVVNLSESVSVEKSSSDNAVLRKLLRGPRYFDPPDKSWGACFNCGEEGHTAVNCTSARRKRPCFICGSLEHEVKQCQKGQDCFICKGQGHRAKDCPKKFKRCSLASALCLKCGASSHAMSSCNNDYSPDDLKDIQCYVCKRFGHLCCENYLDALPSDASCYKCGETGHNGQDCRGSRGETSAGGTPSACFKCGGEGHFARECTNSSKAKKRTRDLSTPTGKKYSKDNKGNKGSKSASQASSKSHKKKLQFDDESPNWSSKSKRRGGWIPDDPGDFPPMNGWRSPVTPIKRQNLYSFTAGGRGSSSQSYKQRSNYSPGTSSSRGYGNTYQNRYSASRFGNSGSDRMRRNHDWW